MGNAIHEKDQEETGDTFFCAFHMVWYLMMVCQVIMNMNMINVWGLIRNKNSEMTDINRQIPATENKFASWLCNWSLIHTCHHFVLFFAISGNFILPKNK
jgi:hypothetical protein